MPRVRRLLGAIAAASLVCVGPIAPPAAAQETAVTMRLISQSPVVARYHRGTLDLELLAFNGGATPLRNLSLVVSFGPRIATQDAYEELLSPEAPAAIAGSAIARDEKQLHFEIGQVPQRITMRVDVERMDAIDQFDSQVYPTLVQLRSESTVVATLVTPMVYLVTEPARPILATTWLQLSAPIAFGADGRLVDAGFPAAIAEGGALRAPLDAIRATTGGRHPHGTLDLVLDPLLITQARDVADGYTFADGTAVTQDQSTAEAGRFVRTLGRTTAFTDTLETVSQPYGDPIVPAMWSSGLSSLLAAERETGRTIVDDTLQPGLISTERTVSSIARPRDGRLSDAALGWFVDEDSPIVLGNDDTVDRAPYAGIYAPSPIVPTASGATLVLPDPATQSLFDRSDLFADPVLGAQIVLGELAVIWKQAPAPDEPTTRGVAVAPPPTLPPDVWSPLLARLSDAPFLKPVIASTLVQQVDVESLGYANGEAPLTAPDTSTFEDAYVARIGTVTRQIEALNSMLPADDPTTTDLRRRLFLSTAPDYQFDPPAGAPWLDSIEATTGRAFAAATPTAATGAGSASFTFTSRDGTIPLQFGDPGPTPLHISVELQATTFTFPDGNRKDVTLEQPGQQVMFDVVAQGSGQSQIVVVVRAPDGQVISTTNLTVRSTAVNHIALLVTVGAGVGLVLLYARRWVRRRRNATT
jgi:hypothetical protein